MPTAFSPLADALTPREIVAELDRYIVGQGAAKRAVAVALRNRNRRQALPEGDRADVMPKNILMIGPTGVGKTEIARRLATLARAPFVKVEATKFTEVGYVGRDVESMIRELVAASVRMVERERAESVQEEAQSQTTERLLDLLAANEEIAGFQTYDDEDDWDEIQKRREARREEIRTELLAGAHEGAFVEFDVDEPNSPFLQVFTPGGMEEMGMDMNPLTSPFGSKRVVRRATVGEARAQIQEEEANKLVDRSSVHREAVNRAEQNGIVFLDEIDKVAGKSGGSGPDVSREGVQRDLLPVIEGSTVQTKFGPVQTEHILFICAGAFHISKPSDLIPELQGRLPIRVMLEPLVMGDLRRILSEPKNALTKQYIQLLATEGVSVSFTDDALDEIARLAHMVNEATDNIGARRLATMLERLLEDVLFDAPEDAPPTLTFDASGVKERLEPFVANLERAKMLV